MKLETKTKPYSIDKKLIDEAWLEVAKNGGSAGVDKLSIDVIKEDPEAYLYKLWNRMSSGSYMASPIRKVEIPKSDGNIRTLGIPTVLDRVAQMAVVKLVEAKIDSEFHPYSYGYRPGRSAQECYNEV